MMGEAQHSRVLVVDDEPRVRNALARTVRGAGLEVVVAATAEEAIALSQGDAFGVVITDLQMPGIGGLALLQQLSPMQPSARFMVVTGTEDVSLHSVPRGHRAQIFRKPWGESELVAAIRGDNVPTHSSFPPPTNAHTAPENVLLIEDDGGDASLFQTALRAAYPGQFKVFHAHSLAEAQELKRRVQFDVIALDLELGDTSGINTLTRAQAVSPHLGLVVMSGTDDADLALRTVQAGAQDYLVKGNVSGGTIGRALRYAGERKRAELRLANIAFHDQLTGLANRTLFRQRVAEALARARRSQESFAVLLLDIDGFKSINDAYGHDAGDAFLCQLADRLSLATRETDVVARLGGDEFVILAEPVTCLADVDTLAARVLTSLRQPLQVAGVQILPTASIGGATYPDSGQDSDALLSAADAAMYAVKAAGRNGFAMHGAKMTEHAAHRLAQEARLREAVNHLQLSLHYQMQMSLDGHFVGAEALLRWPLPDGTILPASQFVPTLEDTGLIIELGPWILQTACRQLADWRATGARIDRMAINISARQFLHGNLPQMICSTVMDAGLKPQDIELELTETALVDDEEATSMALRGLHALGFRVALDDFGTGYGSLAYLQRFPIDLLKIDRSFVSDIAVKPARRNLVGGIIQLANRLGIDVIAEGVETKEQLAVLRDEGCQLVQGFLVGRAMPGPQFARCLEEGGVRTPLLAKVS